MLISKFPNCGKWFHSQHYEFFYNTLLFLSCAFELLTRLGPLLRREQGTSTQLSVGAEPLLRGACRSTAKKDILCVTRQRGQQDRNGRVGHLLTIWEAKGKAR